MVAMTFEKTEAPGPQVEHPAYRAARMIKELHQENLKKIADGFIFMKDGVDVSSEMKTACEEQIKMCEDIMARAESMDPKLWEPAQMILHDAEVLVADAQRSGDVLAAMMPDIGNYDHDK